MRHLLAVSLSGVALLACACTRDLRTTAPDVRVFLTRDATPRERERVAELLTNMPEVEAVIFESRDQAYDRFREFAEENDLDQIVVESVDLASFSDAFCVYLTGPDSGAVRRKVEHQPGVREVSERPRENPSTYTKGIRFADHC